jgi:hypothetical protein
MHSILLQPYTSLPRILDTRAHTTPRNPRTASHLRNYELCTRLLRAAHGVTYCTSALNLERVLNDLIGLSLDTPGNGLM